MTQTTLFLDLTAGRKVVLKMHFILVIVCSQLEEEAIQASQAIDVRRNLVMDIFDADDEEGGCVDKSGSWKEEEVDMFDTDDEDLQAAVKEM